MIILGSIYLLEGGRPGNSRGGPGGSRGGPGLSRGGSKFTQPKRGHQYFHKFHCSATEDIEQHSPEDVKILILFKRGRVVNFYVIVHVNSLGPSSF
jgi:hypothetical protein